MLSDNSKNNIKKQKLDKKKSKVAKKEQPKSEACCQIF